MGVDVVAVGDILNDGEGTVAAEDDVDRLDVPTEQMAQDQARLRHDPYVIVRADRLGRRADDAHYRSE